MDPNANLYKYTEPLTYMHPLMPKHKGHFYAFHT